MTAVRGIQRDFGGFDPKFLGITLVVGSERAVELLLKGEAPRDRATASILAAPREQAFESIAILSASAHEHRHFHDFLIAPVGGLVFRRRISALINAAQVLRQMHADAVRRGANCVPIPLTKWCFTPEAEREGLVACWGLRQEDQVLDIPVLDSDLPPRGTRVRAIGPDAFADQVHLTILQYEFLDRTFASPSPRLKPSHVSEASALLVQEQDIWNGLGAGCLEIFNTEVRAATGTPYARALELVEVVLDAARSPREADRASAFVAWSLFGNELRDESRGEVVERFATLGSHLMRQGFPEGDESVAEVFERWDTELGFPSTLDGVAVALEDGDSFIAALARARAQADDEYAEETLGRAVTAAEMLQKARRAAVERFLADPDSYVRPKSYLEAIDEYPAAPTILRMEGGALANDGNRLEREGFEVLQGFEDEGGRVHAAMVAAPEVAGDAAFIDRALALRLLTEFTVADVLFSPHMPEPADFEICREQFRSSGYLVRQVLG